METKKNMEYYEQLRTVQKDAQKPFNNGRFAGTDINPMWRIKRMTEVFGPCGIGWYYEVVNRSLEKSLDGATLCTFIGVNLFVKVDGEWSRPIYGEGGNTFCQTTTDKKTGSTKFFTTDEAYKMALTDALGNATKQLGLGADVWWESDAKHSTKYDQQQELSKQAAAAPAAKPAPKAEPAPAPEPKPEPVQIPAPKNDEEKALAACQTKTELRKLLVDKSWTTNAELVNYATLLSSRLPETVAA